MATLKKIATGIDETVNYMAPTIYRFPQSSDHARFRKSGLNIINTEKLPG